MTVEHLIHTMSETEYAGWLALSILDDEERKQREGR